MSKLAVSFTVNGRPYQFSVGTLFGQIPPNELLIDTLRNRLGLFGTKIACKDGACGCCTVIMDGDAIPSCEVLTLDCEGKHITTIEGLAGEGGKRIFAGVSEADRPFDLLHFVAEDFLCECWHGC